LKQEQQDELAQQDQQQQEQQGQEEHEQRGEGQQQDTEVIDLVNGSGTASEGQQQHQQAGGGGGDRRRRPAAVMADEARQSGCEAGRPCGPAAAARCKAEASFHARQAGRTD
jgi:hypothetical protein